MSEQQFFFQDVTPEETPVEGKLTGQQKQLVAKGQRAYAGKLAAPKAVGDYEQRAGDAIAELSPLSISAQAKNHANGEGVPIVNYERDYNAYLFPLKATFRAMGRLGDLARAGAPLDPVKAKADPAFRKMTEKLRPDSRGEHASFDQWSEQQSELRIATLGHEASYAQLQAALTGFQAAQYKLDRMRKQAEKESAEGKKAQIDQTIDTLVKIIDVSKMAISTVSKIDTLMNMSWAPSDVDGDAIGKTADEQQAIDDALAAGKSTRGRGQKAVDAATKIAGALKVSADKAKGWLEGAGFSTRDLLMVATGNAKEYDELTRKINTLNAQIQNLGVDIEMTEIKQAEQALAGFNMQFNVSSMGVASERKQARDAAGSFGSAGGTEGKMAMYVVNAYEELALFGGHADQQRKAKLDAKSDNIEGYLMYHHVQWYYLGHELKADYNELLNNVALVHQQRDYFSEKVPEWKARKEAWEQYLEDLTGKDLVK
jgi:hypothetical protein